MLEVLNVNYFTKIWNETESFLGCPKLKGYLGSWLYPLPEDPCKSGDCGWIFCHNYKTGFEESERLIVPEEPLPDLLRDHLKKWKQVCEKEYREILFWEKIEGIRTIFKEV